MLRGAEAGGGTEVMRNSLRMLAVAAAILAGAASPPPGFLVPTPAAIPQGFRVAFESFSDVQYTVQYDAPDDGGRLLVSEHADAAGASYDRQVATLEHMRDNGHGVIPRKLRDFEFDGHAGTIYEMLNSSARNLVLLLDDGGRLLRVSAYDGRQSRFAPDDLIAMLARFRRRK